ncbi:ATP-binding/permease protein CydD [Salmonella enterica subsp. enterica serovar Choleraesuis]|nr:ATP-binding/permease protein CydD [Salmonella enterica subsp. enterica serovar Choleraesuis]
MNKTHQQVLSAWLKQQSALSRRWLNLSRLLGVIGGLLIIAQAWLMAALLNHMIMDKIPPEALLLQFVLLALVFVLRAWVVWLREKVGFRAGLQIRQTLRRKVLDRLAEAGPAWIQGKPVGSWATLVLEQIDEMHDYYARYLPQMSLAVTIPLLIVITLLPVNWAAALILLGTAPLIPLFMALVGMGAADANRRNFQALARLSGHFLDRLRGMETLRLFYRGDAEIEEIKRASDDFRSRTMEVLRMAFLSSAVLEFFASLSIALVAVYFGFSYLGELNFGHYGTGVTLFAGFMALILAPEFFQPLRDMGAFYHAKAQAVGAADSLKTFMEAPLQYPERGRQELAATSSPVQIEAHELTVLSPQGTPLAGPLNFTLHPGQRVALVGLSGAGKSSLLNLLAGFLSYQGSVKIDGIELRELNADVYRSQLSWLGQHPQLPAATLQANVLLGKPDATPEELNAALTAARVDEFVNRLPLGLDTPVSDQGGGLSVGQAQRVALARALIKPCRLLLLDEPAASLDARSERMVMDALDGASRRQTTLMITHQLDYLADFDAIWVMRGGKLIEQGNYATLACAGGAFSALLEQRREEI